MVRAALRARHDYPLMLNGSPARRLAESTILVESSTALVGGIIFAAIALRSTGISAAVMTGALGLLAIFISALSHILSVQRMFVGINNRTL